MNPLCDRSNPPERQTLLLLQAALELARNAVIGQHPRLSWRPQPDDPRLPPSEVLAELVLDRCDDLFAWVERYNNVIDHMLEPDDPLF